MMLKSNIWWFYSTGKYLLIHFFKVSMTTVPPSLPSSIKVSTKYLKCLKSFSKKIYKSESHRIFACHETVAHPSPSCSISANVGKTFFIISVWSTKWNFFNCLVKDQPSGVIVNHSKPITADVQDWSNGFALRILK